MLCGDEFRGLNGRDGHSLFPAACVLVDLLAGVPHTLLVCMYIGVDAFANSLLVSVFFRVFCVVGFFAMFWFDLFCFCRRVYLVQAEAGADEDFRALLDECLRSEYIIDAYQPIAVAVRKPTDELCSDTAAATTATATTAAATTATATGTATGTTAAAPT